MKRRCKQATRASRSKKARLEAPSSPINPSSSPSSPLVSTPNVTAPRVDFSDVDNSLLVVLEKKKKKKKKKKRHQQEAIKDVILSYKRTHAGVLDNQRALNALYGTLINARFYHDTFGVAEFSFRNAGHLCHIIEKDDHPDPDGYGYLDYYCSTGDHVADKGILDMLYELGFIMNARDLDYKTTVSVLFKSLIYLFGTHE